MANTCRAVEAELRRRIAAGAYPPGSRLPSHRTLMAELGASSLTVQRACDRLVASGHIESRGAHGTFVAACPPVDGAIALVFPHLPGSGTWNRLWSSLQRAAEDQAVPGTAFRVHCIEGERPESTGHRRLVEEVEGGMVGGLLFATPPFYLGGSPLLTAALPRVVVSSGGQEDAQRYRAGVLAHDREPALAGILDRFAGDGRRRLGVFGAFVDDLIPWVRAAARSRGLECRSEWCHGLPVDQLAAPCARSVAHLLASLPVRDRPDCLLINDDNLVPHVTAGLSEAGPGVAAGILVAAHANFPGPTPAVIPALRYGPDASDLLAAGAALLQELAGGAPPRVVAVPWRIPAPV